MKFRQIILFILVLAIPFVLSWPKAIEAEILNKEGDNLKIVVLNYHKVDDKNLALSIAPQDFDQQMEYLAEEGYHTITPDQLLDYLEFDKELPEKPVLITFDDGYEDNYKNAYPILKKYGFKATIFVITDYLNVYPNYITWNQAKEMNKNGITIASHTMQHKSMTTLTDEEIQKELEGSAKAINYHLGKQSQYVAYPTGTYNLHIARLVKESGYRAAFSIKYGNVDKASNLYALERVPIFRTNNTFRSFLERIRYVSLYERLGWIKS